MKSFIYVGFIIMAIVACKKTDQNEALNSDSSSMSVDAKPISNFKGEKFLASKLDDTTWNIVCLDANGKQDSTTLEQKTLDEVLTTNICESTSPSGVWNYSKNTLTLQALEISGLKDCNTYISMDGKLIVIKDKYDLTSTSEPKYSVIYKNVATIMKKTLDNPNTSIISKCDKNVRVIYKNGDISKNVTKNTDKNTCIANNGVGTYMIGKGTYKGACENGKANGYGILTYPDGEYYKGNFLNGLRNGKGTQYLPDDTEGITAIWENGTIPKIPEE